MHLSIEQRMLLGFALVVVLTLFITGASVQVFVRQRELNRWEARSYKVQTQIQHVLALVTKAKAGERGFLLSGDIRFIDSRTDDLADIEPDIASLQHLIADDPVQQTNILQLHIHLIEGMRVVEQVIRLARHGQIDVARQISSSRLARTGMDNIENSIAVMVQEEEQLLKQRTAAIETYQQNTTRLFLFLLFLVLVSLIAVYVAVRATYKKTVTMLQSISQADEHLAETNLHLEQQMLLVKEQAVQLEAQKAELEEANQRLTVLAITDGLTGLNNHRAFQEKLAEEFERTQRYKTPTSVLLLDVDKFKTYNDTFGHPEGDLVLKTVSKVLQETARETDTICRYGGEEFVIVLPSTGEQGAIAAAEKFRTAIEQQPWRLRTVTASFGIATLHADSITARTLVVQADQALYSSKETGRNRVTHYLDISLQKDWEYLVETLAVVEHISLAPPVSSTSHWDRSSV
jgi:diguanylate cyclase (GGDEF)-like protein